MKCTDDKSRRTNERTNRQQLYIVSVAYNIISP